MRFYTGIASAALFNAIFTLIKPYIPHITYSKGPKHAMRILKRNGTKKTPTPLNPHDEFPLALTRLRLGLLNEDVGDCFDMWPTKPSFIFTTWIKLLSKLLKNLVAWMPRELIQDNLPEAFVKTGNNKFPVILDCTEVFIEIPKPLDCQAAACFDYKHHSTIKFVVGISPSGFITFLSSCYDDQASDKFITKDSGFYDLLERDDVVMSDCGFQIQKDLLLHFCNTQVPPGARATSQMTKKEVQKAKEVENLRIQV